MVTSEDKGQTRFQLLSRWVITRSTNDSVELLGTTVGRWDLALFSIPCEIMVPLERTWFMVHAGLWR